MDVNNADCPYGYADPFHLLYIFKERNIEVIYM